MIKFFSPHVPLLYPHILSPSPILIPDPSMPPILSVSSLTFSSFPSPSFPFSTLPSLLHPFHFLFFLPFSLLPSPYLSLTYLLLSLPSLPFPPILILPSPLLPSPSLPFSHFFPLSLFSSCVAISTHLFPFSPIPPFPFLKGFSEFNHLFFVSAFKPVRGLVTKCTITKRSKNKTVKQSENLIGSYANPKSLFSRESQK